MIARITGRLEETADGAALVDAGGGLTYEVRVPAYDVPHLSRQIGQEITLHTIHTIEGDPAHGTQTPRLIGFLAGADRDFFLLFTTVKGIGVRKALRALVRPVGEVAAAIQAKDTAALVALPEIGKRSAEQIIAELHGKVEAFAGPVAAPAVAAEEALGEPGLEAVAVLVQLGERRADAVALVQRALRAAGEKAGPEAILQQAYRIKSGGR